MAFLRRPSLSIPKVSVLLAGAGAAAAAARFAVPYAVAAVASGVPRVWSLVRFFLVPPYLFITVHLIIVAIWKLSDQKLHKNPGGNFHAVAVKPVVRNAVTLTPSKTDSAEMALETSPIPGSMSAESCVTAEAEEDSPGVSSLRVGAEEDEDSAEMGLEDTWKAILTKRSATWERSSETVAVAAEVVAAEERAVRRSVTFNEPPAAAAEGNDELNKRFEAFIKKNYDQIRSY